jgi:hypothetical protein
VNEASQDTESIKVVTTEKSYKTLTSELILNLSLIEDIKVLELRSRQTSFHLKNI